MTIHELQKRIRSQEKLVIESVRWMVELKVQVGVRRALRSGAKLGKEEVILPPEKCTEGLSAGGNGVGGPAADVVMVAPIQAEASEGVANES